MIQFLHANLGSDGWARVSPKRRAAQFGEASSTWRCNGCISCRIPQCFAWSNGKRDLRQRAAHQRLCV